MAASLFLSYCAIWTTAFSIKGTHSSLGETTCQPFGDRKKDYGISQETEDRLCAQDLTSQNMLSMLEPGDIQELGLTVGQRKLLEVAVADINQTLATAGRANVTAPSSTPGYHETASGTSSKPPGTHPSPDKTVCQQFGDEIKHYGLSQETVDLLCTQDITSHNTLALLEPGDIKELHLTVGLRKLLEAAVADIKQKLATGRTTSPDAGAATANGTDPSSNGTASISTVITANSNDTASISTITANSKGTASSSTDKTANGKDSKSIDPNKQISVAVTAPGRLIGYVLAIFIAVGIIYVVYTKRTKIKDMYHQCSDPRHSSKTYKQLPHSLEDTMKGSDMNKSDKYTA